MVRWTFSPPSGPSRRLRLRDLRTRGFEGSLGAYTKTALLLIEQGCFVYMRMKGLEPTRLRTRT